MEAFQAQMSLGLQNCGADKKKKMMTLDNYVECHKQKGEADRATDEHRVCDVESRSLFDSTVWKYRGVLSPRAEEILMGQAASTFHATVSFAAIDRTQ